MSTPAGVGILSLAVIHKLHRMAAEGIDRERNLERAKELRNRFVGEKDPASLIESSRLNPSAVSVPGRGQQARGHQNP